ncbi:MAG: putative conjugal transfer protein [Microbacterium sp.]|nr:putative conjugal transfer protein [Microbacterium sp.]
MSIVGVPGAATIHANSAREALGKLAALPLLAGRNIDARFVQPAVAASVHLVAHCERDAGGARRVVEIVAPTGVADSVITARTLYRADAP